MNLLTTIAGSMMEGFLPRGWDLAKIDGCCSHPPESIGERQPWWHPGFEPVPCDVGRRFRRHAGPRDRPRRSADARRPAEAALILPVGPMGMYRWAVYFLKEWGVACDHVHGFNMDEWSDRDGQHAARRPPRRLPERDAGGLLRPARAR